MTYETIRRGNSVPWEWQTTAGESKHWRQFSIDDLREMVAKRYGKHSLLSVRTREELIRAIERWRAKA